MKGLPRPVWLGAIAILALVLLTLLAAPDSQRSSGSTFSRSPEGYGAWYAYMQQQGLPIQRWQKPLTQLPGYGADDDAADPITLVQVNSELATAPPINEDWVARGNRVVILGVKAPVTTARYISTLNHPAGIVQVATRRRQVVESGQTTVLGDRHGAVIWQRSVGKGTIILATTPHLAANAYQDAAGNYPLLAQLVSQPGQPIWVDEYLHGYRDTVTTHKEVAPTWESYLLKTPIFPIALQVGVLLLVLIWSQNRRFGVLVPLTHPTVDNSTAYIQALANVLWKAESGAFVQEVISQAERQHLQQALGLGTTPVEPDELIAAWTQQTGRPATDLQPLLLFSEENLRRPKRPVRDADLLIWREQIQQLRQHLPQYK